MLYQIGGTSYTVELGGLNERISTKANVTNYLPHLEFKLSKLTKMFASGVIVFRSLLSNISLLVVKNILRKGINTIVLRF